MTRNRLTRPQKKWLITNKSIIASIFIIIIIFSLGFQGAGELVYDIPQYTDSSIISKDVIEQTEFSIAPGFVFPSNIMDVSGLSMDENSNGIEDFIEANKEIYRSTKLINTVVTLTQPASDWLVDELEKIGCTINDIFTIIDAVGVSIPVDRLHLVGQLPTVKMIQSVHEIEEQLNSAVPLTKASQDILSSNGYSDINGEGVTIAVIDSGIDGDHNTFNSNRIIAFKDFIYGQDDLDPTDGMDAQEYGYHGTMVANCAAGSGTYKGVAIKSNIISVAVYNTYEMIQGIQWCVNFKNHDFNKDGTPDGPDVITMSLGVPGEFDYLDNAAGSAMDNGVVFTTSAGNDGPNPGTVGSPATSAKVIGVGATNKYNKQISSFSSRGPGPGGIIKPDIVAPGEDIITAYPGNQWTAGSGTSFSGPIIAGICALILQYDPTLDPYEVKDILLSSAEDLGAEGPDNTYGYGFVDAVEALDRVLKIKSISASPSSTSGTVWEDTEVAFSVTTTGMNIKKYEWDFDNDGEYETSTTNPSAKNTFLDEGTFDVKVRITNQRGKTAESSYQIEITNRKPIAELDIDDEGMVIYEDEFVKFNASKSRDTPSDTDKLEFSWSFDGGLNYSNFSKADEIIEHSFAKTNEYKVIMRVRDDNGETDTENKIIAIQNLKPTADAGEDIVGFEGEPIQFSGSRSYDSASDLPLLKYTWDFGDDTIAVGKNLTHTYYANRNNQIYEVKLTVRDDNDEEDSSKITVTIRNCPPTITMDYDRYGSEDEEITLSGAANDTMNDRGLLKYKWIFDDGNESNWVSSPTTKHVYTAVGNYHANLLVQDPKGAVSEKTLNVTITNIPPVADFKADTDSLFEDEMVSFDASTSFDTESDIEHLKYVWDFGDGTIGTGKTISHKYYEAYKYSVKLTVKDDDGDIDTITKRITVENLRPDAKLIVKGNEFKIGELIKCYGYKSTDSPSDKKNLTYRWDFGDGEYSTGINTTHKYKEGGEYTISLRVADDDGEKDEMRANIKIESTPVEEDIFTNPTIENKGALIYLGVVVVIIILIILLLSLMSVYKGKKTIFGKIKDKLEEGNEHDEKAEDQEMYTYSHTEMPVHTGMTPEQERFFTDYYGISPQEIMRQQQRQAPNHAPTPDQNTTGLHAQTLDTHGLGPGPGQPIGGQSANRTMRMQIPPYSQNQRPTGLGPEQNRNDMLKPGMPYGSSLAQTPRMMPGSQALLPPGKYTPPTKSINNPAPEGSDAEPMDEFVY